MKNYFCLNLRFKDDRISNEIHHAHLYIEKDDTMFMRIFIKDTSFPTVDRKFMESKKSLDLFEDNFHLIDPLETTSTVSICFDNSRIYKVQSWKEENNEIYFTIYLTKICMIYGEQSGRLDSTGQAILNLENGLEVINNFYSYFNNIPDNHVFSMPRIQGMDDFYKAGKMSFRPELDFRINTKINNSKIKIQKIPIIKFKFEDQDYEQIKNQISIICRFLSFCFGIRVYSEKFSFYKDKKLYVFRDNEPNHKTYISWTLPIFQYLKKNCRIEIILKTDWGKYYLKNEKKISKAIDNYLHSREVNEGASFLLLFNVLEIFNLNLKEEKFEFSKEKHIHFDLAFNEIKKSLKNQDEIDEFRKKWESVSKKLSFKPFKSPFEKTLTQNNIILDDSKYTFGDLKETRDKITHGSIKSISNKELEMQVYHMRRIAALLILSNLGFNYDFRENIFQF